MFRFSIDMKKKYPHKKIVLTLLKRWQYVAKDTYACFTRIEKKAKFLFAFILFCNNSLYLHNLYFLKGLLQTHSYILLG